MSTKPDLYEKLLPYLPQEPLPIVRASVDALGQLPGLDGWNPTVTPDQASRLVRLGFALTFLSSVSTCDALKRRIADEILKDRAPVPSDLAEVNGAALCAALGAVRLECIKRSTGRTPDFKVCWPSQTEIDLEVTCAHEKPAHVERRRIAGDLAQRIHDKGRRYDIVVHYINPPTEEESTAIIKASTVVTPEQRIEETGKWAVRALRLQRETYTIMTVGEPDKAPNWWPQQPIKNFVIYGFLAGPGDTLSPPQTRVI